MLFVENVASDKQKLDLRWKRKKKLDLRIIVKKTINFK